MMLEFTGESQGSVGGTNSVGSFVEGRGGSFLVGIFCLFISGVAFSRARIKSLETNRIFNQWNKDLTETIKYLFKYSKTK